jgi:hypothetical protein
MNFAQNYGYYIQQYAHLYALEKSKVGEVVARAYEQGVIKGWDAELAKEQFNVVGTAKNVFGSPIFKPFTLDGNIYKGDKHMIYDIVRKVLGKDTPNYPQEIGDCVSFGGKNATEYVQCSDILLRGASIKWRPIFPPFYYHTSRMKAGGGRIPAWSDGSLGSWLAESAVQYGALFSDGEGVPKYSGRLAKNWGGTRDIDSKFYEQGKKHIVHSVAQLKTWEDLVAAMANGYCVSTASNVGYSMSPSSDGFHRRAGNWAHQMAIIGVGFKPEEYGIILNNWGDVHGRLKDFDDQSIELPVGCLRVRKKDIMSHINAGETYAWSQFDGFPDVSDKIERALFKVVGN